MKRDRLYFSFLCLCCFLFCALDVQAQQDYWKGQVKDAVSGEPMIGVSVRVKGTGSGTITDFDGNFTVKASKGDILVISYVGYKTLELDLKNKTTLGVISLGEDTETLEEVVVVGYGVQKKVSSVGSIATAKGDDLLKIGSVNSVSEALQGQMPGVVAINSTSKPGEGIYDILNTIVEKVPAPKGDPEAPLQCLIFDSVFNPFRGIIAYFKVVNGVIRKGDHVKFIATGKEYDADEVGVLKLTMSPRDEIRTGDVGYIISGIKTSREVRVGDTITHVARPAKDAIAGFEEVKPMVFAGVYPIDSEDFENLRASLEKLQLNDASLTFQPESSAALGFGFRCGFLGLLHMEIVQERLDREFNMDVITTVPNVSYKVYDKKGNCTEVHNPGGLPDPTLIDHIDEPYIRASVITNTTFIGPIMTLCLGKRGILIKQEYISGDRVEIHYDMPLGEIVIDFYDKLKSISKGYASFDYHIHDFRPSKLVKLDILLNGEPVDALSTLTHMDNSVAFGRRMCEKLKELIPRQQFDIAIQAAIGAKIIARETIKAVRKDVTAKCYGGDISRKRKLLEKQKEGKKRMKQIGTVEVPQKAFLAVLKLD